MVLKDVHTTFMKKSNIEMKFVVSCFFMFLFGFGALFLDLNIFVDAQLQTKWYFVKFAVAVSGLLCSLRYLYTKSILIQFDKILSVVPFIVLVLMFGLALHGIFQFLHLLPGTNGWIVVGSFDNPAGFSASLCAGLPFCFTFFLQRSNWKRWVSLMMVGIIISAVLLSESRAGALSVFSAVLVLMFIRIERNKVLKIAISMVVVSVMLFALYSLKKDSADGRLLIWRCSLEMIKEKPFWGYGYGGFKANYMNFQAKYFEENPDSGYSMLADNVSHPFNEYILLVVNFGLVGLLLLFALSWFLLKTYKRCRSDLTVNIAATAVISIAVFAFFSYPFRYPFTFIILALSVLILVKKGNYSWAHPSSLFYPKVILIPVVVVYGIVTYRQMTDERLWYKIANESLRGKSDQMLPYYDRLHKSLEKNELFLYNYAAELNVVERYEKSIQIALECEQRLADYDLQMLLAENYMCLYKYEEAEKHYKKAAAMCPVRFLPLQKLVEVYVQTDRAQKAASLAQLIIDKEVKVPSASISSIKNQMQAIVLELILQ